MKLCHDSFLDLAISFVTFFCYHLLTDEDMQNRVTKQTLPKPNAMHHIVEDFLTAWDGPSSHILPLRRFLESIFQADMRHFTADECFQMSLMYQNPALMCDDHFLSGRGLTLNPDLFEALPSKTKVSQSIRRNSYITK